MPAAADSIRRSSLSGQHSRGSAVERLEGNAERGREGAQIGFFAQRTCRDQDAVGADAQRRGSARGVIDHFAGEPGADAVDLRAAVGLAGGAGGDFGGRGIDRGAVGSCGNKHPRAAAGRSGRNCTLHSPVPPA